MSSHTDEKTCDGMCFCTVKDCSERATIHVYECNGKWAGEAACDAHKRRVRAKAHKRGTKR